jgi:Flp pilus assembly protein TadG
MHKRMRHLRRDERGMTFVFVGLGFMAFMAASTLAIDVGMFMTAKSQAQNAADAGALAGAVALYYNDFDDRTSTGPAVQSAISSAQANLMMGAAPDVDPGDVTFPNDPSGQPTRVKVDVFRTAARDNPIPTLIGPIFGVPTVSISATATAEASQANAETCVKPFTIPDRWQENQDPGGWDADTSTFDLYDNKGKAVANPDVYIGPEDAVNYTGYNPVRDKGMLVRLKADNNTKLTASFYNPWDLPGSTGASDYRDNIANCNTAKFGFGVDMPPENGNMVGPTKQGMDDLIAKDPSARWDTSCNCVADSGVPGVSPRVAIIPVFDPVEYANGKQHGKNITLKNTNYIGVFIEKMQGGEVFGRITPVSGIFLGNAGPAPAAAFPVVIRLVQ